MNSLSLVGDVADLRQLVRLSFRPVRLTAAHVAMKHAFALAVASVALLVSAPLQAGIDVCIRLSSRGRVLIHQERIFDSWAGYADRGGSEPRRGDHYGRPGRVGDGCPYLEGGQEPAK